MADKAGHATGISAFAGVASPDFWTAQLAGIPPRSPLTQGQSEPAPDAVTVFRIETAPVQVDARVNGRKGRKINDLSAADSEIFQDAVPLPGRGTRRAGEGFNSREAEGLSL